MTARRIPGHGVVVACAMLLALGCEEQPTLAPTPLGGSATAGKPDVLAGFRDLSSGPWQFAGTVYEHTASGASRPLAGLQLQVSEYPRNASPVTRFVTSDAEGRYDVVVSHTVKVEPSTETGYLAPCPAGTAAPNWGGGARDFYLVDVHVVHRTVLATTGTPDLLRTLGLYITGRIVGPSPSHDPVAAADVELDNYGFVLSRTVSDAAGRYLLCSFSPGSGTDQSVIVRARKPGYREGSVVAGFQSIGRDIELVPQ